MPSTTEHDVVGDPDETTASTPLARMRDRAGRWLAAVLAAVLVVPLGSWAVDRLLLQRRADAVAAAAPALADAVVLVAAVGCDGRPTTGSGFAVELDGEQVVLTNRHVVDRVTAVSLRTLAGRSGPDVTGVEVATGADVAVLRTATPLPSTLALGDPPLPGDEVRLVGFPGARPVTSTGPVAAVEQGAVLLDLQVDGGASGAPVVDADDRVVAQVFARRDGGLGVATGADRVRDAARGARAPAPC